MRARRLLAAFGVVALLGVVLGLAFSGINLNAVGQALAHAELGWLAAAFGLMVGAFLLRAWSWQQVLRAALPRTAIPWGAVVRAAMIGVLGSAVLPGRLGEPARTVILSRHLPGRAATTVPLVAGTLLSQTLMNLIALGLLAVVTFSSVSVFSGREAGLYGGAAAAFAVAALLLFGPRLLGVVARSRRPALARLGSLGRLLLARGRQGLSVFARPRQGVPALLLQLAAWALQWLSCYAVVHALALQQKAGLVAAAAVLLAVNVSAILPPTPSNVGIFQGACVLVLAAYGVPASHALAYGFALQGVEFFTALLLGGPALLGEGIGWRELRRAAATGHREASASGQA